MKTTTLFRHLALTWQVFSTDSYTIDNCGTDKVQIQYAISSAQTALGLPLLRLLNTPNVAFKAMFKTADAALDVHNLMMSIISEKPIHSDQGDLFPEFACATPRLSKEYIDYLGYDPWKICGDLDTTSFWRKTNLIWICPAFLVLEVRPQHLPAVQTNPNCPILLGNAFLGNIERFVKFQSYELLYHLIRMYLQHNCLGPDHVPREATDWNECIRSRIEDPVGMFSIRNPMNYIYYTACEYSMVAIEFSIFTRDTDIPKVINQNCRNAPDPFLPPYTYYLAVNGSKESSSTSGISMFPVSSSTRDVIEA